MENESIHPVHTCPVNRCVVLFEQWGYPLVGWFCPDGSIGFPPDQYTGQGGFHPVQLRVAKKDIVGWLPLPSQPAEGDWRSRLTFGAETPLRGEQILHAIRFFSNIQHLASILHRKELIARWYIDENGPDGVGGKGAWRLKIQPFFDPGDPLLALPEETPPYTRGFIQEVHDVLLQPLFTYLGTMHNGDFVYSVTGDKDVYSHEFDTELYIVLQTALSDQVTLAHGFVALIPYSFKPV